MKKRKYWLWIGIAGFLVLLLWSSWMATLRLPGTAQLALRAHSGEEAAVAELRREGKRAVPSLIRMLDYEDLFLRRLVWRISPSLPRQAQVFLFKRVGYPQPWRNREAGARGLGLIGPEASSAVPALMESLRDPTGRVRWEAADALVRIGKPSVPGLADMLQDPDVQVRTLAIYALGQIGPDARDATPELLATLRKDAPDLRGNVADTLQRVGVAPSASVLSALRDPNATVRDAARNGLQAFYGSAPVMITNLLASTTNGTREERALAVNLLGATGLSRNDVIDRCVELLGADNVEVRRAATNALEVFAGKRPDRASEIRERLGGKK